MPGISITTMSRRVKLRIFHFPQMKADEQKALLDALRPVLRDRKKAAAIMQRHWSDRIAFVWSIQDVLRAGNEKGLVLKKSEARRVLAELQHTHNKQYGIKWSDMTDLIEGWVLGRKIKKQELKQFIDRDIITIQPEK